MPPRIRVAAGKEIYARSETEQRDIKDKNIDAWIHARAGGMRNGRGDCWLDHLLCPSGTGLLQDTGNCGSRRFYLQLWIRNYGWNERRTDHTGDVFHVADEEKSACA